MSRPGQSYIDLYVETVITPAFLSASPADRINTILGLRAPHDVRFLSKFLERDCKLESVSKRSPNTTTAVFRFRVERFYCNGGGNLHGGAAAAIYDMLTSLALQSGGGLDFWVNGGVSRTLNVTYLRPAPEGTDVVCEVEVVQAGRTQSFLRGEMKRANDGVLISTCEHNKAAVPHGDVWRKAAKL